MENFSLISKNDCKFAIKQSFLKMLKTRERVGVSFRVDISIPITEFPIFEYLEISLTSFSAF
jgi:hypothetical protein